ncbi:glycerophosphodiester phosphodiesterase [Desulfovibrio inopinatus]|uniref:glycerophosphodiester phosphodiesterase n=1 Tax=Desulfovibrio inopinatus TaxID=102109 RepID=UPI0003F5FB0E|nr:glycerophosphodiester phosphodiesterase family protein [Desulfovibrio inopinatus]
MFFERFPGSGYVCAHRGARSIAPENTMSALQAAVDAKADFWELDVQKTADGALVVFHDDFLNRTTDIHTHTQFLDRQPWPVSHFTIEELRQLNAGSWFLAGDPHGTITRGEIAPEILPQMGEEGIPTLDAVLECSRKNAFPINIEIKDQIASPGDVSIVRDVYDAMQRTKTRDMVLISSFNHEYLRIMHRIDPDVPLAALVEEKHPDDLLSYLQSLGACGYHPDQAIIDTEFVQTLAGQGIKVSPYTVNDMDWACALLEAGCFSVITDFPQTLRRRLTAHSM